MAAGAALAAAVVAAGAVPLGSAAAGPRANPAGPPPAHTGGFGEPTCLACHFGDDLNAYGGSVHIDGLPDAYVPGERYTITVVLRADETAVAGFEAAARFTHGDARGAPAGTLRALDDRVAITPGDTGIPYAHQTASGSVTADPSGSSWRVEWTAPQARVPVAFHVAANSGNGDSSPLGDLVYAAADTVTAAAPRSGIQAPSSQR